VVARVVRLGSPRIAGEGLRIGTVRLPPRGVPKARFAGWSGVWPPLLAPGRMGRPRRFADRRSGEGELAIA
jgi:uncharacterized protein YeaO (DUF488 family)